MGVNILFWIMKIWKKFYCQTIKFIRKTLLFKQVIYNNSNNACVIKSVLVKESRPYVTRFVIRKCVFLKKHAQQIIKEIKEKFLV